MLPTPKQNLIALWSLGAPDSAFFPESISGMAHPSGDPSLLRVTVRSGCICTCDCVDTTSVLLGNRQGFSIGHWVVSTEKGLFVFLKSCVDADVLMIIPCHQTPSFITFI